MNDLTPWQRMARMASLGTEFLAIFAVLLVAGLFADSYLGTMPILTVVGAVLGFGLGLYRLVRDATRLGKQMQDDRKRRPDDFPPQDGRKE